MVWPTIRTYHCLPAARFSLTDKNDHGGCHTRVMRRTHHFLSVFCQLRYHILLGPSLFHHPTT